MLEKISMSRENVKGFRPWRSAFTWIIQLLWPYGSRWAELLMPNSTHLCFVNPRRRASMS